MFVAQYVFLSIGLIDHSIRLASTGTESCFIFAETGNGDSIQRCDGIDDVMVTLCSDPGCVYNAWDANLCITCDVFLKKWRFYVKILALHSEMYKLSV